MSDPEHRGLASLPKDGQSWRIGTAAEVAWIAAGTHIGRSITAAVPPVFAAYATLEVADPDDPPHDRYVNDRAILALLTRHTPEQMWWLGYLDTGVDDVVFPAAPMVTLYAGWRYVFVEAGPEQAARWRSNDCRSWRGALPNVMFPHDRSWLVSTLWDDDWRCIGGSAELVSAFVEDEDLTARRVDTDEDATPPGHISR